MRYRSAIDYLQQVVDGRAVAHDVDDGPLPRELAHALDRLRPHADVAEGEAHEEPREEPEALEHRRGMRARRRRCRRAREGSRFRTLTHR
jgi:hypothetical protein